MREMGSSLSALAAPDSDSHSCLSLTAFPLLTRSMCTQSNPSYPSTGTYRPWIYLYQPVDPLPLPSMSTITRYASGHCRRPATRHKWSRHLAVTRTDDCREHCPRTQATALKSDLSLAEFPHFDARCRAEFFHSRELDPRHLLES
jgi:hypothetical protein